MTRADVSGTAGQRGREARAGGEQDVLLLAGRSAAELAGRLEGHRSGTPDVGAHHQEPGPRVALIGPTRERCELAARIVRKEAPWRGRKDIWFSPEPLLSAGGGIAFVFPGLEAEFSPSVTDVAGWLGTSVGDLDTHTLGRYAASVFTVNELMYRALRTLGLRPDALAGHSVGEWSAMRAAGILPERDFVRMIERADLDALRVPGLEFAVLGCSAERAASAVRGRGGIVVSHENSPNQTVVCGPGEAVSTLVDELRANGVISHVLPFQSGFHTPMFEDYLGPFRAEGVPSLPMHPATIPVWSATTATRFPDDPGRIRDLSVRHMIEPVRFGALIRQLYDSGVRMFVQAGCGQLGSLVDDTLRQSEHLTITANSPHRSGTGQLRRVAAAAWVEGGNPDFSVLDPDTAAPAAGAAVSPPTNRAELAQATRLRELGARFPAAAEFGMLLEESAASVAEVIEAADAGGRGRRARPPRVHAAGRRRTAGPHPAPGALRHTLPVDVESMPHLLDHCMAAQRAGWPDHSDRRPVMPATGMIAHLAGAARAAAPGRVVTEVSDVRLRRWLVAAPGQQVPVEVEPLDRHRVSARLGGFADAVITLGDRYPDDAPEPWPPARYERVPELSARRLYDEGWMFHGPAFQGITRSTAISPESFRAEITVPSAPGALLDNVGQMIGQWLVENHPRRCIAFPARIERIRFHAPEPPTGQTVGGAVRVTSLSDEHVVVDGQVTVNGSVGVSVTGWQDYRVDGDERACAVHRLPGTNTIAREQPGGWWLLAEPWNGLASREFFVPKYLGASERAEYEACDPPERRRWLLARVVVKDAVRGLLWRRGHGAVYPAELHVSCDRSGRYRVGGVYGLRVGDLPVAVDQCDGLSVAWVPGHAHAQPDVAIGEVSSTALETANDVAPAEERLLDRLRHMTGDALPVAMARLAVARMVVRRARPGEVGIEAEAIAAGGESHGEIAIDVASATRSRRVRVAVVPEPGGTREYAVARTDGAADNEL
ncbi:Malonyl CoA-acyl carrier protein transacylase [Haloechinothrix alba]|uniref:Malonyl CoA-acyl carrier protein transacylase n=1 Tax=Haloechinothrix alba TaxID=664784 RepID=A0A238VG36_9PSEU|nr:acyltransferase domain-containing protein [Haloechinothrix alba]SNR33216.1 Malonyl CoA-acyl carrier protein transacylase [Haloechinothrix alba]